MKRLVIIFLLIVVSTCGILTYYAYQYYAPPHLRPSFQMGNNQQTDTIRIAYIGDSWAFLHYEHPCIISKMIEDSLHIPAKVYSYGICGLTSRGIYKNIFDNDDFRHFFQTYRFNYCFISAGINDTYRKISISYYKKSMDGIIQLLLDNHIHPIIMEVPDYNIQKAYENQTSSKKALRQLSMIINNCPLDCKQRFRDALDELVKEKGYNNDISIIRYKSWNDNLEQDFKDLYVNDGMHLNEVGYVKLDSIIANTILKLYINSK